jgi:hypothetical protein
VTASDIRAERNWRQGLSVTALDRGRFIRVRTSDNGGTAPQAGIDIEPDRDTATVRDLEFVGCEFARNSGAGIMVQLRAHPTAPQRNIRFSACTVTANGSVGVYLANPVGVAFSRCVVSSNTKWGVDWETGGEDVSFSDCVIRGNGGVGIAILTKAGQIARNVTVKDTEVSAAGAGSRAYAVNIEPSRTGAVRGVVVSGSTIMGTVDAYGLRTGNNGVTNVRVENSTFSGTVGANAHLCDEVTSRVLENNVGLGDLSAVREKCPR